MRDQVTDHINVAIRAIYDLEDEVVGAQRQLASLFPDRAQDGTLSHAVLVVKAEVQALWDEIADRANVEADLRAQLAEAKAGRVEANRCHCEECEAGHA